MNTEQRERIEAECEAILAKADVLVYPTLAEFAEDVLALLARLSAVEQERLEWLGAHGDAMEALRAAEARVEAAEQALRSARRTLDAYASPRTDPAVTESARAEIARIDAVLAPSQRLKAATAPRVPDAPVGWEKGWVAARAAERRAERVRRTGSIYPPPVPSQDSEQ